ncbi:MAG TPA: sigma 54-interacting transcriptional regulator [Polyangiaceae bacterium]
MSETSDVSVSRNQPLFRDRSGRVTGALASAHVSRQPIRIAHLGDATLLDPGDGSLFVGLVRLERELRVTRGELLRGLVLGLGDQVVLWLGPVSDGVDRRDLELIGTSAALSRVQSDILQVADLDVSVLLRGESGVGKELVAAALHRHSKRAAGPYVPINMAAIPPSTAVAELFGHARGAFTGASGHRAGHFGQADGGTLFLDEIGQTPNDIQPMLLRAIETGEVQGLGGNRSVVNVRVVAATDSNLEQAIELGRFHFPLLRRFEYVIFVPPLRERKEDIGPLFLHFVRRELRQVGESHRLAAPDTDRQPWVPAKLGLWLLAYDWPGNVRELRNLAKRYVINNRGRDELVVDEQVRATLGCDAPVALAPPMPSGAARGSRDLNALTDEQIADAWRRSGFNRDEAAKLLGVGPTWLGKRLDECRGVRLGKQLSAEEIRRAYESVGHDLNRTAHALEVTHRALVLQIKNLQLKL